LRELLANDYEEHLSYEELESYVDRTLPTEERTRLDEHIITCRSCSVDLANLSRVAAAAGKKPYPFHLARWLASSLNVIRHLRAAHQWQPGYTWSVTGATVAAVLIAVYGVISTGWEEPLTVQTPSEAQRSEAVAKSPSDVSSVPFPALSATPNADARVSPGVNPSVPADLVRGSQAPSSRSAARPEAADQPPTAEASAEKRESAKGELVSVDTLKMTLTIAARREGPEVFVYTDTTRVTGAQGGVARLASMSGRLITVHYKVMGRERVATSIEVSGR
jgi:hypothetical protein